MSFNENIQEKKFLNLNFHGRIIEHLGIQMYQSPVAAIAEIISNAWDADATEVDVIIDKNKEYISIRDNGLGMTFQECQDRYLAIGYCRRDNFGKLSSKNRKILGRKGIGKFAGFGIANKMKISTISHKSGEQTEFILDLNQLCKHGQEKVLHKIDVYKYIPPDDKNKNNSGTKITLLDFKSSYPRSDFPKSMARRFLFYQDIDNFKVTINGNPLPNNIESKEIEFDFPKDYTSEELSNCADLELITIKDCIWGKEKIDDDNEILWKIMFYKTPLKDEEMRGVSIFAGIKIAQLPFFFEISGSISAGHALQYLSGKIQADFIDSLATDVIATERQRINWEISETATLKQWGENKIKELANIWKKRRGEEKIKSLDNKIDGFQERINKLQPREQKIVRTAMRKLANIESIDENQLHELCKSLLVAWERGRLKDLIENIAFTKNFSQEEFLELLKEASILSALNIAEAIKTKIEIITKLQEMIFNKDYENAIRNYIAKNPWLISQKWETFKVETSLKHIFSKALEESKINKAGDDWNGRIDLVLKSGSQLLVLEFMRPGLNINQDHLGRLDNYIGSIKGQIKKESSLNLSPELVVGYMVADRFESNNVTDNKIEGLQKMNVFTMTWATLLSNAKKEYTEYIEILAERSPNDLRILELKNF